MIRLLTFILLCITSQTFSQFESKTNPIVEEGKMLYRSEMASWYGTDLFLEKYADHSKIGGYVSYPDGDVTTCIFYSREEDPKVVGTISFDSSFDIAKANIDIRERTLTETEQAYLDLRNRAKAVIASDTIFKSYEDMNFNIIPVIKGKKKQVYVLTGPKKNGYVIFGNDYLIDFDSKGTMTRCRRLHRNIIQVEYQTDGETMHTHLPETGEFITATDVCTLLLYGKIAKWKNHIVVSDKYLSIWNCDLNSLFVMTMKDARKITDEKK
ncbi:hypothetical protein [Flavobacterium sp. HJ-32-4]|uniref:hypothetical protein n=2 Tax=unclassified Flavobacterium TaxID=196869 RepID=UPI001F12999E|nr:hypothetical protein [Flavobacterium sp. HJ-32-4]UMY64363.1 hypothetical protein MKO97_07530 [Flavobacterium sp. HJ-32-4]